ncbi:RNA 2',3'-cyclic phosphodiesterase [Shewanella mangrovisoli]|uniref:RNA 2',3'-cyclic phosphodiesterase n=1 Tax=Shewanella mangrovisoli TaxID=2864211 RepID=A0ABV4VI93_9GAMM
MLQRLFLGFAPTSIQRQQLLQLQQSLRSQLAPNAKAVTQNNLHLTLAFLGLANPTQVAQLLDGVDKLTKPKLSVTLDSIAVWPKAQVCCLKGDSISPELALLASQAQDLALKLQLHLSEHPFRPHISLFRKAKPSGILVSELTLKELVQQKVIQASMLELTLAPEQLHLYLSTNGGRGVEYQILHSWPLA